MRYLIPALASALFVVAACHESQYHEDDSKSPLATQVSRGHVVFASNCARCHGDHGEGGKGPPLVGANALPLYPRADQKLRTQPFHTALDVAQFVTHNMPPDPDDRKKLTEDDYWAVLAFDLDANQVPLRDPVTKHNADSIVLHPK